MKKTKKVVVVGAGLSGLVCAQALADKGFDVVVVDKGRRPGGRLASRQGEPSFDYGAQYFTVSDLRFREVVDGWLEKGLVLPWNGRFAIAEQERVGEDYSLSPSSPRKQRYVGVPKMNAFTLALSCELARSATVLTQHRVTRLEIDSDSSYRILGERPCDSASLVQEQSQIRSHGEVESGQEKALDCFGFNGFNYVVLNLPPLQVAALIATASGALPELLQASKCFGIVDQVELSPCFALMVQFAQPLALEFDGIKVSNSALAWVARDSSKPGRTGENWVLHASPEWSHLHLEDSLPDVSAALLNELGLLNRQELPPVTFSKCHRWRYALAPNPLAVGSLLDSANKIGYCGDWCQGNNIEAAFLSGRHMADQIIRDAS
ncbi:NAD(P)-binding protein [bacterium]|nr:NAD(P)-binding protein [bacterium]